MTLPLLYLLVAFAIVGAGGWSLRTLGFRFEDGLERHCFTLVVGYVLLAFLATVLGIASLLSERVLLVLLPLLGLLGVRDVLAFLRDARAGLARVLGNGLSACIAGCLVLAAAGALTCVLAPPTFPDVLQYHYAMPRLYAEAHGFQPFPRIQASSYRSFVQSVQTVAFLLEGERLAGLIIVSMNLLIPFLLYAGVRRRLHRRAAAISAALFAMMPVYAATVAYPLMDNATALFSIAAFFALMDWVDRGETRWLILAALLVGFVAGIKINGFTLAPVLLMLAIVARIRSGVGRWGSIMIAGLACVCVPVPLLWLNVRDFGNPVFPFFLHLLGGPFLAERMGEESIRSWYESLLIPWWMCISHTSVGPQYLLVAPIACVVRGVSRVAGYALAWALLSIAVMTGLALAMGGAGMHSQHYWDAGRFMMFAFPPLALFCGEVASRCLDMRGWHRRVLVLFLAAGGVFGAGMFVKSVAPRVLVVLKGTTREQFLAGRVPMYETMDFANRHLEVHARVLVLHPSIYYLHRPCASEFVGMGFVPFQDLADARAMREWLGLNGFTHLLVPGYRAAHPPLFRFLDRAPNALTSPSFLLEYKGPDGSALYRIGN